MKSEAGGESGTSEHLHQRKKAGGRNSNQTLSVRAIVHGYTAQPRLILSSDANHDNTDSDHVSSKFDS